MCWRCDIREAFEKRTRPPVEPRPRPTLSPEEFCNLIEAYAARHGLDDDQAVAAIYRHGRDGNPEFH